MLIQADGYFFVYEKTREVTLMKLDLFKNHPSGTYELIIIYAIIN